MYTVLFSYKSNKIKIFINTLFMNGKALKNNSRNIPIKLYKKIGFCVYPVFRYFDFKEIR